MSNPFKQIIKNSTSAASGNILSNSNNNFNSFPNVTQIIHINQNNAQTAPNSNLFSIASQKNQDKASEKSLSSNQTQKFVPQETRQRINSKFVMCMKPKTGQSGDTSQYRFNSQKKSNMAKKSSKLPNQLEMPKDKTLEKIDSLTNKKTEKEQSNIRFQQTSSQNHSLQNNLFKNNSPFTSNSPAFSNKPSASSPLQNFNKIKESVQTLANKSNPIISPARTLVGNQAQNQNNRQTNQQSVNPALTGNSPSSSTNNITFANRLLNQNAQNPFSLASNTNKTNPNHPPNQGSSNTSPANNFFSNGRNIQMTPGQSASNPIDLTNNPQIQNTNNSAQPNTNTTNNINPSNSNALRPNSFQNSFNSNTNSSNPFNNSNPFVANHNFNGNNYPQTNNIQNFNHNLNNSTGQPANPNFSNTHQTPHYISAEQYIRKQDFRDKQGDKQWQSFLIQLQKQSSNQDLNLEMFAKECFQNLDSIYKQLQYLSTRPSLLLKFFKENKVLEKNFGQLQINLKFEPHNFLVKIRGIEDKIVDANICVEKMQCKIQNEVQHQLSAAIKDHNEVEDNIAQEEPQILQRNQNDLVQIYDHLANIDKELSELNSTADYYLNLLKVE